MPRSLIAPETPSANDTGNAPADVSADASVPSNGKTALTDAFREHFAGDAPITDKARNFAKARPWTSAALVGVATLALLNTLRSRR